MEGHQQARPQHDAKTYFIRAKGGHWTPKEKVRERHGGSGRRAAYQRLDILRHDSEVGLVSCVPPNHTQIMTITHLKPEDLHWPDAAAFTVLGAVLPCVSGWSVNCDCTTHTGEAQGQESAATFFNGHNQASASLPTKALAPN